MAPAALAGAFSFVRGFGYTGLGAAMADNEVYFEITVIGTSAKVVALDAATGIEVAAIGPANASMADLKALALGKLKARIAREAENP